MNRQFGAHWLAFLGALKSGEGNSLEEAVIQAAQEGCQLFELACHPVNDLSAIHTARALKNGGITNASYCRFFPGDGSCGDPLAADHGPAVRTIERDIAFIDNLRKNGINVEFMTGPAAYLLGADYGLAADDEVGRDGLRSRAKQFLQVIAPKLEAAKITLCLEYLRPGEDFVLGSMQRCVELVQAVRSKAVRIHFDTFHALERDELPHESILVAGNLLGYVHAHGSKRLPPGAFRLDGNIEMTDLVNWHLVGKALTAVGYHGPIVPEPFGPVIRQQVPALGEGLPPPIAGHKFYDLARRHLQQQGVI